MIGLRGYQEEAVTFAYERNRSMILAPVGAGKTLISLTVMKEMLADKHVTRWLVVAPLRVCRDVWPAETRKWTPHLSINIAIGSPKDRMAAIKSASDIVVINYENLQWLASARPNIAALFGGVVFDELSRLKNPSGKRFKAFLEVVEGINLRIGLTGSFTSNGLEDVFGQCKIIDQSLLGRSKGAFLQQHFWSANPQFGDWIPRPGALQKIMDKIKPATYLLEPGDYKDKLPPMHLVEVRSDMDMTQYNKMKKDFVLEFGADLVTASSAGVVTAKLTQMSSGWVYQTETVATDVPGKFKTTQTPHWISTHKFDALDDLMEENHHDNTVIFYWYKEELAELKRRYPKAQTLDDANAVERWNAGSIPLLLAHPMSAGHGLNLQFGGCKLVFLTMPWSLELFEQAIGRLHRSGQKHDVWVYLMITNNTIDDQILAALQGKQAMSEIAVAALK